MVLKHTTMPGPWYFARGDVQGAMGVGWPARDVLSPVDGKVEHFVPDCDASDVAGGRPFPWLAVFDEDDWLAQGFEWSSPLYASVKARRILGDVGVRATPTTEAMPLMHFAAWQALRRLPKPPLR